MAKQTLYQILKGAFDKIVALEWETLIVGLVLAYIVFYIVSAFFPGLFKRFVPQAGRVRVLKPFNAPVINSRPRGRA